MYIKRVALIVVAAFPLVVLGATSTNFQLNQEGAGFTEFSASSTNYKFNAAIGDASAQMSTSTNYIIDQGKTWFSAIVVPPPPPPQSPGNGGGGGGGGGVFSQTGATFSGRAYPLSRVNLLKDGQIVASTIAGPDARFSVSILGINAGNHLFSVIGEDKDGLRSQPFTVPITLAQGATTQIGGLYLAPTLTVDKKVVKRGDNLAIFGQTVPQSVVIISVSSPEEFFRITDADASGVYLYNFDTTPLVEGDHTTKAKSAEGGEISEFGRTVAFEVGDRNILNTETRCPERGDLTNDCRVNLIDLSIAGFWYKKPLSESLRIREASILNGDGIINLVDLSIIGFYWTG